MFKTLFLIVTLLFAVGTVIGQPADGEIEKLSAEMSSLYRKGDLKAVLPIASRIVDLTEQKFGKNDLSTARALKNRGFIENSLGDTKKASISLEYAADIYKKQPDLNTADGVGFAQVLEVLGGMQLRERNPSARVTIELALKWREKSNGAEAPETATAMALLASLHFWKREYKRSSELYEWALMIMTKTGKGSSEELSSVYYRTKCSFRKADNESAFEPLKRAYEEQRRSNSAENAKPSLIQGSVVNGKALKLQKPAYPVEARGSRVSVSVRVDVLLGEDGTVLWACGAPGERNFPFVEAAEIAAYNSRFSPTTLQGTPVKVTGWITYKFGH
jgi:tetratricopeptide (TPR) repeat protein